MKLATLGMRLTAGVLGIGIGLTGGGKHVRGANISYANPAPAGAQDFTVGANWTGGNAPTSADTAIIDTVDGVVNYPYLDTTRSIQRFTIAGSNATSGGLELRSGGNLTGTLTSNVSYVGARGVGKLRIQNGSSLALSNIMYVGWGDGSGHGNGDVSQTGGSYVGNTANGGITIGYAAADANFAASVGSYNLSSGNITLGGPLVLGHSGNGSFSMSNGTVTTNSYLQVGRSGTGTLTQTGGALSANRPSGDAMVIAAVAGGTGKYEISGGSLSITAAAGSGVANGVAAGTASGTFKVIGDGPTSIAIMGDYKQYAGANLALDIGVGITPINLTGNAVLGGALNVAFTSTPSIGQQFVIMNYGGTLAGSFGTFDNLVDSPAGADTVNLSINYGTGSNSAVVLTVVPEPNAIVLLVLGTALAVPWKRKV